MTAPRRISVSTGAVRLAQASGFALVVLCVLWEAWLAPLRPGGSWLVLKVLPLVVLAPGIARAEPKALQWAALLTPFYVAEAAVRMFEPLPYRACALLELVFAATFFIAAIVVLQPYRRAAQALRKETHR